MSEHYFSPHPATPSRPREVTFELDGRSWRLASDAGVFSADRLDPATEVLLRTSPATAGRTLLDLGCGYGAIACVLAARAPAATVWAVDVNERALGLARENATALGLDDRLRVAAPHDVPAGTSFDEIWSNPPVRVGKDALHALLLQWLPRLAVGGTARLVVARHLGADSLQRWLGEQGFPTQRHASRRGFRVLRVERASDSA